LLYGIYGLALKLGEFAVILRVETIPDAT